jgi:hypothetical protein
MDEKDDELRARDILARNLTRLIETGQTSFARLVKAEAGTSGTISRIRNATSSAGVDQLDRLGYALDLEAWQLLHPDSGISEMGPEYRSVLEEIGRKLAALPPAALQRAAALCAYALDVALKESPPAEAEPVQPPPRGAARSGRRHSQPKSALPKAN